MAPYPQSDIIIHAIAANNKRFGLCRKVARLSAELPLEHSVGHARVIGPSVEQLSATGAGRSNKDERRAALIGVHTKLYCSHSGSAS